MILIFKSRSNIQGIYRGGNILPPTLYTSMFLNTLLYTGENRDIQYSRIKTEIVIFSLKMSTTISS